MSIASGLSVLTLRPMLDAALGAASLAPGAAAIEPLTRFLSGRFRDQGQRLLMALGRANEQAWKALEVALAGPSLWQKVTGGLDPTAGFRRQIEQFLREVPVPEDATRADLKRLALAELRTARRTGLLAHSALSTDKLAEEAGRFALHADPGAVLAAETRALSVLAEELKSAGHVNLAWLIVQRPAGGEPVLLAGARYFFRRAVEADEALFRGLAFARLESLHTGQEAGFAALAETLETQGEQLEAALAQVQETVLATHAAVLDLRQEMQGQREQLREIGDAVLGLLQRYQVNKRELRPADSFSIRDDAERRLVKELVRRYRSLPEDQRCRAPALLNGVGTLELLAGNFDDAQRDFQLVAGLVATPDAQAEAYHNAYRAALERRQWDEAFEQLSRMMRLTPDRAPLPLDRYEPEGILGAGGFGVAILCRHRFSRAQVVVKSLFAEGLDRGLDQVFAEASALARLDHPAVIRLADCGYVDPVNRRRPYVVMDFFEGQPLQTIIRDKGPLSVPDALAVLTLIAQGLQAAHGKHVLHRDVKPANILALREDEGIWQVKIIDFGLALGQEALQRTAATSTDRTIVGGSLAGTLDYAAPEQLGRLPGVAVSFASDVYGFGRTGCFLLFGTTQPLPRHWRSVPHRLAELLEQCLEEHPAKRPGDFREVLTILKELQVPEPPAVEAVGLIPVPPPLPPVLPYRAPEPEELEDRPRPKSRSRSRVRAIEDEPEPRSGGGGGLFSTLGTLFKTFSMMVGCAVIFACLIPIGLGVFLFSSASRPEPAAVMSPAPLDRNRRTEPLLQINWPVPTTARPGETWTYRPEVISSSGPVTYEIIWDQLGGIPLQTQPRVDSQGVVWNVASTQPIGTVSFRLRAKDAGSGTTSDTIVRVRVSRIP